MPQTANRGRRLFICIDEVLGQSSDNAVATRINPADLGFALARCFNDSAGGGVDDGSHAARLSIKSVLWLCHGLFSSALHPDSHEKIRGASARLERGGRLTEFSMRFTQKISGQA